MPYMPTSPPGIALAQLRRMVSLSAAFIAAVGATDETDAVDYVLIGRHPFTSLPDGIGAIAYLDDSPIDYDLQAGGEQLWLHPTGAIVLQLVLPQPDVDDLEERYLRGVDFFGNIAKDVKALSDSEDTGTEFGANHLAITSIAGMGIGPRDVRFEQSDGVKFLGKLLVRWGIK